MPASPQSVKASIDGAQGHVDAEGQEPKRSPDANESEKERRKRRARRIAHLLRQALDNR